MRKFPPGAPVLVLRYCRRTSSGSLAKFTAIRRASSRECRFARIQRAVDARSEYAALEIGSNPTSNPDCHLQPGNIERGDVRQAATFAANQAECRPTSDHGIQDVFDR